MIFVLIGLACVAGGIGFLVMRRKQDDRLLEIKATKESTTSAIIELAREIGVEIGPGGYSQLVEVKGIAESENPLTSELAEKPSIWYKSVVEEEYEESIIERDSDGTERVRTQRTSEIVSSNTRGTHFRVRDDSGTIRVDIDGATIESETILDRHEPYHDDRGEIRLGAFSFRPSTGRRVLGYRYREEAIPVGSPIYVIGEATDRIEGTLTIRKPSDKSKPFIVSVRSEEEIVETMEKSSTVKKWVGLVLLTIGVVGVLYGIVDLVS